MSYEIKTENAPAAIGPYVQGVDLGNMLITSGQIPIDPKTGEIAEDIIAQTTQSLKNIQAIVEKAGLSVANIVKTTVFVKDMNDFARVNATYEAFFNHIMRLILLVLASKLLAYQKMLALKLKR